MGFGGWGIFSTMNKRVDKCSETNRLVKAVTSALNYITLKVPCRILTEHFLRPCFSSLFFHQTYAGARKKKQNAQRKKTMAQCPRLPDRQMTNRTQAYCVERSHSFVYFWPNNDRVKQLPVATKVWLFLVLDLSSLAKNVLESSTDSWRSSTLRMRDRSLDGKLDRGLDSRPSTYPNVFVKARPHYYQQSLRSMISTERILLWFSVTRQCNSLASA